MMILKSVKDFFAKWCSPLDLSPEREEEIINKVANFISKYDLEDAALLLGGGFVPVSSIIAQTTLLPIAPLLELMGLKGYEYTGFLSKKENFQRLLDKIQDLEKKKKRSFWR
jgi:hypothetical protein